jgi:DNA-binding winged helix-turn-helix (wHTH) protein
MPHHHVVRFGPFALDLRAGEVHKHGTKIRLHGQPVQVLGVLVERPGDVVTREELRARLWGSETFVDFEHGLHAAVNKLRVALNDAADHPRYIETIPRRGYRFIGTIESSEQSPEASPLTTEATQEPASAPIRGTTAHRPIVASCLASRVCTRDPVASRPSRRPVVVSRDHAFLERFRFATHDGGTAV